MRTANIHILVMAIAALTAVSAYGDMNRDSIDSSASQVTVTPGKDDTTVRSDVVEVEAEISENGASVTTHRNATETVSSASKPNYAPNEVIFKLVDVDNGGTMKGIQSEQLLLQVAAKHGIGPTRQIFANNRHKRLKNIHRTHLPASLAPIEAAKQLAADPAVEWAEPNYYRYTQLYPNDPYYVSQWHLPKIGAPSAWDTIPGARDAIIAIIDSGVQWDHPDLMNNIWINPGEDHDPLGVIGPEDFDGVDDDQNGYVDDIRGWDFVSVAAGEVYQGEDPGPPDNDPMDVLGHGTHVYGIVGAVGNNGVGVTGICWDINLMPVRAGYKDYVGRGVLQISDVVNALVYAADNGAHIVNMSFGGYAASYTERVAIDYCAAAGVLLVAAAGNDATDEPIYPAGFTNVMAVAAVDAYATRASFSNYGSWIDLAAPGSSIFSTLLGGDYGNKGGTSMASPVVAGVAGLVKGLHPQWTAERIAIQLTSTASNINAENTKFVNLLGAGQVAADQAVTVTDPPVKLGVVNLWAQETIGNSDGKYDPGETVALWPSVRNFSVAQTGISVNLQTGDPHITILDNLTLIGDSDQGQIGTQQNDPMSISILADTPPDHLASLTLEISADGYGVVASDVFLFYVNPTFGDPQLIAAHPSLFDYIEPQIIVRPSGELTVLYRSNGFEENQIYARSASSPDSWEPAVKISESAIVDFAREHHGAIGSDGWLHVCFMALKPNLEYEIFHVSRDPVSGDWTPPVQISAGAVRNYPNHPWDIVNTIAVDDANRPHVVWVDYRHGIPELIHVYRDETGWTAENIIGTPTMDPYVAQLVFNSKGTGYLFWTEIDFTIYQMTLTKTGWSSQDPVIQSYDLACLPVAFDSLDWLHMVYTAPENDDVSHIFYKSNKWSDPQSVMLDTYVHDTDPLFAIDQNDQLFVLRRAWPDFSGGNGVQFYETTKDADLWTNPRMITFDRTGNQLIGPNFNLTETGHRLLAAVEDTEIAGTFVPDTDIIMMSSDRDPTRLPSRPLVTDSGDITDDHDTLSASWSSSHP
ncbi:MAG: S8 family peptidase, partial [Planctomycetota bacterium]